MQLRRGTWRELPGFNAYAIEMFINIVQNEVLLSEAESHQSTWAATANWKGGSGKNIEIDILQENRNKDIKGDIRAMGAKDWDERWTSKECQSSRSLYFQISI